MWTLWRASFVYLEKCCQHCVDYYAKYWAFLDICFHSGSMFTVSVVPLISAHHINSFCLPSRPSCCSNVTTPHVLVHFKHYQTNKLNYEVEFIWSHLMNVQPSDWYYFFNRNCIFVLIKVLFACDGWPKTRYEKWKECSFVSFSPFMFSSITLLLVLYNSPWAVRPKSGQQMRHKWVLSSTHEGGSYGYHSSSGRLYPTATSAFLPSSSLCLPAILSDQCGNVGKLRMEGWKGWDERRRRIKETGWKPRVLTGPLPVPTPSPEPRRIRALLDGQEAPSLRNPSASSSALNQLLPYC